MRTQIITTTLTKDIWLNWYNQKAVDKDYANHERKLCAGAECNVKIDKMEDGRKYFTYFAILDGHLFTNISMTKDGIWVPNCGMSNYQADQEMINFCKNQNII